MKFKPEKLKWLNQIQEEEGVEIPDLQPPLFQDLQRYFDAFWWLSARREIAVGMGGVIERYISTREIESYFNIMQIDRLDDRMDYMNFLSVLDSEYLKYREKNKPVEDPKKPKPQKPRKK